MSNPNEKSYNEQKEKIKKIQEIIYPILCEIDDFCTKNNIQYFLCAGTCLGAVRHHGFIPWDYDADIMLPREDYDKFIHEYSKSKNRRYRISSFETDKKWEREFCRVWDDKTFRREKNLAVEEIGVFVDVFPIDGFPERKISQTLYLAHMKLLYTLGRSIVKTNFRENEKYRAIKKICGVVLKPVGLKHFAIKMDKLARKYPYRESKYVGVGICPGYGRREIIPRTLLSKEIKMQFVDAKLSIPSGYDEYLTSLYDDYMSVPEGTEEKSYKEVDLWELAFTDKDK